MVQVDKRTLKPNSDYGLSVAVTANFKRTVLQFDV